MYHEENLLINGDQEGKISFWNENGKLIKSISFFKTGINNLLLIRRPYELEEKNFFFNIKKPISYQSFSKFDINNNYFKKYIIISFIRSYEIYYFFT